MGGGVFFAGKRGMDRQRKRLFLIFFYGDYRPAPPPALPVYPAGGDPSPRSTRNGCTRQAAGQTTPRTDTHAQKLDTLHRSALDTRQAAPGRSGRRRRWKVGSVSETVQKRTIQNLKNKYAKKRKYLLTFTQESV